MTLPRTLKSVARGAVHGLMASVLLRALCLVAAGTSVTLSTKARAQAGGGGTTAPARPAVQGRIVGTVFDSLSLRPLSDAVVQMMVFDDPSKVWTTTSDAAGAFHFDSVNTGTYALAFLHPVLDSISARPASVRLDIRNDRAVKTRLAVPSARTLIRASCGQAVLKDSSGMFTGIIRSASGEPLSAPAQLFVQWAELAVANGTIERRTPAVVTSSNAAGSFVACGVPPATALLVRAWSGPDSSGYLEFEMPGNGYLHRQLFVAPAERSVPDSTQPFADVVRGNGIVRGSVQSASGEPLAGARVMVWSSGAETTTDERGQFRLAGLPLGTYTLDIRAIGYEALRRPVHILANDGGTVVSLIPLSRMDTVRVNATRVYTSRSEREFEMRRKSGFGYFIDEDRIAKRNVVAVTDLLRLTPGMLIRPGRYGYQLQMRGTSSQYCTPGLFIDGIRFPSEAGDIDMFVNTNELRAVEVYPRVTEVPIEYRTMNSTCGAVLLWTGPVRRPPESAPKVKK